MIANPDFDARAWAARFDLDTQPTIDRRRRERMERIEKERAGLREFITDVLAEELPDAVFAVLSTRRKPA